MGELHDRMEQDLKLAGYSPSTVRIYLHYGKAFAAYFNRSPSTMREEEVRTFLLHLLTERKLSHDAYRQCFAALKFLYTFTLRRPFEVASIPRHRKTRRLPDVLSGTEVTQLLLAITRPKYRMVGMSLYAAGLRVSEACSLKVGDIDSKRMLIHIRMGKGAKDRYVMLSRVLLHELRSYWRRCQPPVYLFPGRSGSGHISPEAIRRAIRRAAQSAGLTKDVTPHLLRHSFATHLLETGTDVTIIKALLGHRRIHTTLRYTAVSMRHIQRIRSPLDLLGTPKAKVLG